INSISLICVGVYFLKQIISIKNKSQRLRLKGVSFGFIIAGLNFIVTPFIKADFHTTFTAVNMTLCFLVIALMSIASIWKNKTPRKKLA
ncbi:hypothetical protein KDA11_03800, partial [Candidatus Saccharibacteria bacterium]|nr:hypothetical protein [Candidatus Saccharibacteria bacterium]